MDAFVQQRRFIGGILQDDPSLRKKHKKFCRLEQCTQIADHEYCENHRLLKDQVFCSLPDCKAEAIFESAGKPYCEPCLKKIERNEVVLIDSAFEKNLGDNCQSLIDGKPCGKLRAVGFPGYPALYCTAHSIEGMILRPKQKCRHDGCDNYATYTVLTTQNISNPHGHRCEEHKQPNSVSVIRGKCKCGNCGGKIGVLMRAGIRKQCQKTNNRKKISVR